MSKRIDTLQITLCKHCDAVVKQMADLDGNYYCGRCGRRVESLDEISKQLSKRGYRVSVGGKQVQG